MNGKKKHVLQIEREIFLKTFVSKCKEVWAYNL